jgi:hypothetical protein
MLLHEECLLVEVVVGIQPGLDLSTGSDPYMSLLC